MYIFCSLMQYKIKLINAILICSFTVALVIRKSDSWLTASTSGEDFMMVFTRDCGKHTFGEKQTFELSRIHAT